MKSLFSVGLLIVLAACSSTRQTSFISSSANQARADRNTQIVYAKMTFEADQKNNLTEMLGPWFVHTMKRQSALPEETLNLYMSLSDDQTFSANTTCGELKGQYSVKGMSIKFSKVVYNRNECGKAGQLDEMVRLLTNVVSLYAFNGNMLFLKDNSGNNVFRVTR